MDKVPRKMQRAASDATRAAQWRMWRHGILLGFLLAIAGSFSSSYAQGLRPPCGANENNCRLSGTFGAVSVTNPALPGVTAPSMRTSGALIYSDFVQVEQVARENLDRAIRMRESISPYNVNNDFDQYLRTLDYESGFTQVWGGTTPYPSGLTFLEIVYRVESDLRTARDLYAFLAVFAPENRFRADVSYVTSLCGLVDKEDPVPASPNSSGEVLPPVVDWCNFKARLRQSVREAANVRMIIGQEFMVDALGMNFSGGFIGGEDFVRQEVARLRAAQNQFRLAEQFLAEGLKVVVGNNCRISDFYMQAEWSLLSRAAEQQGTIHYLVGSRLSYLGVSSPQGATQAKTLAQATIRQGANDNYIKLLGLIHETTVKPGGCALGENPNGDAVATMAINMLDAQQQARNLASGRNIFGFDTTFTPARAYRSSIALTCDTNTAANRGLWDEARCSAELAAALQDRAELTERLFDASQSELRNSIDEMIQGLDKQIDNVVGCNRTQLGADEPFFACARTQIELATGCMNQVEEDTFLVCMATLNQANDITTALFELRSIFLEYKGINVAANNISQRVTLSKETNAIVTQKMLTTGVLQTTAAVAQVLFDSISCVDWTASAATASSALSCAPAGAANALVQGTAGAVSMENEIDITNAENEKEIENLFLDAQELSIAAQSTVQAFFSKRSDVEGMLTALARDVVESERQRAYFNTSPANDPSFRIVRDSARLELAKALERSAKIAYLAARRAEYEYAARLAASNFAISDIYRARTAQDILAFLDKLQIVTNNLAGAATQESDAIDLPRISVAKNVLLYTDEFLKSRNFTTPAAIEAERTRLFRQWVKDHTITQGVDAPVLAFTMTTSLVDGAMYDNLLPQGFDLQWRFVLAGIDSPKVGNNGVSVNLVTDETGNLSYRKVAVTQGGLVHLRSQAGCLFDYRLIAPAVLLGQEWASNQNAEQATVLFNGNVNNTNDYTTNNFRTSRFEGRSISATEWKIEVFSGAPEGGLQDMSLDELKDIELIFSATYVTRSAGNPQPSDCARLDY